MEDYAPPLGYRQQSSMAYEERHYQNCDVEQINTRPLKPSAVSSTGKMAEYVGLAAHLT